MPFDLSGKTVLVTGASRGIGAAAAEQFAQAGAAKVAVHYNSHRPGAEEVAARVRQAGADCELLEADLSTGEGIRRLVESLEKSSLQPDILVNNAGSLIGRATLQEFSWELYEQVMNLNVKSVWFLSQAVVGGMIGKGGGAIVNLSSIAGRTGGGPGATIYAAAKAAVTAMTKGMAKELAPKGIRVNAISPGTVDNYFHEQFSTRQMLDNVTSSTPAGRLGTNEDMANAILFLCSPEADYIHGQTIELNGGFYAP